MCTISGHGQSSGAATENGYGKRIDFKRFIPDIFGRNLIELKQPPQSLSLIMVLSLVFCLPFVRQLCIAGYV
jgi:hypothetical protein